MLEFKHFSFRCAHSHWNLIYDIEGVLKEQIQAKINEMEWLYLGIYSKIFHWQYCCTFYNFMLTLLLGDYCSLDFPEMRLRSINY